MKTKTVGYTWRAKKHFSGANCITGSTSVWHNIIW